MAPGDLLSRWCRVLDAWGAPHHLVEARGGQVLACYREAHRRYHTTEHLSEVLTMVGDLVDLAPQPAAVELAAWFHDVIYDPRAEAGANEDASAAMAAAVLGELRVSNTTIASTERLIAMTVTHEAASGDLDAAVLADADLWILASPRSRYARYAEDVKAEYGWLDDDVWARGRSAVLEGFLARRRLFATDRAHTALDAGARANLAWEMAALLGTEPQP